MPKIFVYDTTLRDGSQGEGISLSVSDKLKIAKKLDNLSIDYIEGGWPGSNPKDLEFFSQVKEMSFSHAKIAAFGSTRRPGITVKNDPNLLALVEAGTEVVTIFGKSWDLHVHEALATTLEENLAMIAESVAFLKAEGLEVIYDAEHFFDGYKHNSRYALSTLHAAADAGADWIILCDTNGGMLPDQIKQVIAAVKSEITAPLGIHTHNDGELAVANSISAVNAGATQIQGTINGLGERCGNANLCSLIPNLQLKHQMQCLLPQKLELLTETSRYVAEIANVMQHNNQPFVGQSAFAHKGGIHVSAVLKNTATYEHLNPELIGNERRVLVSELSGNSNFIFKARELGMEIPGGQQAREITRKVKELEHQGYQFEGAEASLELLVRKTSDNHIPQFDLESFKIMVEKHADREIVSEAVVKVRVDDKVVHTAAEGNGPVNALDNALRKALEEFYPEIAKMHLTDYKVRVLEETDGTAAKVRVLIESRDAGSSWSTVGVSENIIEASWQALLDSMEYALIKKVPARV